MIGDDESDRSSAARELPSETAASETADQVAANLEFAESPTPDQAKELLARIAARQAAVGFEDYKSWKEKVGEPC